MTANTRPEESSSSRSRFTLERPSRAFARMGVGRSTGYAAIKAGLLVPPVPIGPRAVAFPGHEVDAIIAARICGRSDEEIKSLVADLVAARQLAA
jgi:prophage regulatory protein